MISNYLIQLLSISFILTFIAGCGGLSIAEFHDAETIAKGKTSIIASGSGGPEEFSTRPRWRFVKFISPSVVEPRLIFGITDRLNIGFTAWSGLIGPIILTRVLFDTKVKFIDFGTRGMVKYRVTSDDAKTQFAYTLNITNYVLLKPGSNQRVATGIAPGFIVSQRTKNKNTLYAGFKTHIFNFHDYWNGEPNNPRIFCSTHLGLSEGFVKSKAYFELIYSYVKRPLSQRTDGHIVSLGVGYWWNK